MTLYLKPNLILTSVAIAAQLLFTNFVQAQSGVPSYSKEDQVVVAADSLITVMDEKELQAISYGKGFVPYISEELIADRLSCLQNEINLEYNRTTQSFIEFFVVRRRELVQRILSRTNTYFPIFEEYLKKHHMPPELKYLSVVESALNPRAISPAKAGGLWQFMPGTGRDFRLYQDNYVDERFDPYKSTEAACKYLKQLYNLFGDWELALASYNCGPGNVRRAIRKSGNRTGFWEIYNHLPRETRSYVPQFVALTYVLNYAEDYQLMADSLQKIIPFDTIQVSQHINLEALARQIDTPLEELRHLNPHLKKNVVPQYLKNYPVRIPSDRYGMFNANRLAILDSVSKSEHPEANFLLAEHGYDIRTSKLSHKVRRGESLARIADRYNVDQAKIKKWNRLRSNKLSSGRRLTIWVEKRVPVFHKQAPMMVSESGDSRRMNLAPVDNLSTASGNTAVPVEEPIKVEQKMYHTVRRGESLNLIADKYHVSIEQLKEWNQMKGNTAQLGRKLTIFQEQEVAVSKKVTLDLKADTSSMSKAAVEPKVEKEVQVQAVQKRKTSQPAEEVGQKINYTVQKGDGLFRIASKHHVTVQQLKEWNQLSETNVKVGQQLVIWQSSLIGPEEEARPVAKNAESNELAKGAKSIPRYHKVQKGDTLWSISRQYGDIPVEKIKKLNKLRGNELKAGQKLILG
jgi:membrane-bound lytic murein transglycosylase D